MSIRWSAMPDGTYAAIPPGKQIQARDEIDGRHGLGLGLADSGFQHGGHAAEPELSKRALDFGDVHGSVS
jgi:hypothetical protein